MAHRPFWYVIIMGLRQKVQGKRKEKQSFMKKYISILMSMAITIAILSVSMLVPMNTHAAGAGATAATVNTTSGGLNVRSTASTSGTILTTLPKGSCVTLISKNGSWWKVEYANDKFGYCHQDYLKPVAGSFAAYVNVTSGNLNVRTGPGTTYAIQGQLPKNTGIVVLSQSGDWSKVLYHGTKTGYVSNSYLKAYTTSQAVTYPAIQLSVPNFKQNDSRWSNYPLGTTGKTIATVGCLSTAVAMAESYRTKTTIYPHVMASRLNYMADGTMYWPSHYAFDFNANYLQALYNYLKSGKTVLFGAKGAYGQHWVVVTGYTGGNTLTAAGFTIQDPGSNTRTNLQQLLNVYPTFYKIAYYR